MVSPDWTTLRIILAAMEAGSVMRAAEHCGIANSAAAKRVQMLEEEYGVSFFERLGRGSRPTAAGEVFARHARALLDTAARLEEDLRALSAGGLGSVRLQATASVLSGEAFTEELARFVSLNGGIKVELREDTSLAILSALAEGQADVGIVTTLGALPVELESHEWRHDRLIVTVPKTHPFVGRETVDFGSALDQPLIGTLEHGALTLLLEEAAGRLGRRLRYRFTVSSGDATRRLVAGGHGIAIMPEEMLQPYAQALGLQGVSLAEPWSKRTLRLVSRPRGMLPVAAQRLVEHFLGAVPGKSASR
jgi:DNA-binding transcriptional LysR family regulator